MVKNFFIFGLVLIIPGISFAGTAYIPVWQHGYGVTYYNIIINTDSSTATCSINLIDIISAGTYWDSNVILPDDAWQFDTWSSLSAPGFGWGYIRCNGPTGKAFGWGAIYGTVSGKICGLTVLLPTSGF
ncbi:MAG: hypothetical protein A2161_05995 [Candidatus Schekmanbacteria bacterium RBG_13_48_7]|uniref:Uncharacterized protein n=1 Tax=Candidatus Schekmanbacteria bacterium RBG_13_48_7 TaxID=1817878 RepID=A0A1F7RME3_9BACT|nr:MAG: hypothetical protein A2161_05995 [Candidatus Schekmanbacteria bacterium RBG_13_48_7]